MRVPRRFIVTLVSASIFILAGFADASAQVLSIYGTCAPVHISNVATGSTTGLNPATTYGSFTAYGFGGGVTYAPVHLGPVRVGLDLRASTSRQSRGADIILGGIRVGGKLPVVSFKPYVEVAGGYVGVRNTLSAPPARIPAGTVSRTPFWAYDVIGGVDYALLPFLDLRLIEVGGGKGSYRGNASSGNVPNISLLTINSGVVVHF